MIEFLIGVLFGYLIKNDIPEVQTVQHKDLKPLISKVEKPLKTNMEKCPTQITEIWVDQKDPKTGKALRTCRGKLLMENQDSRIIKMYGKGK